MSGIADTGNDGFAVITLVGRMSQTGRVSTIVNRELGMYELLWDITTSWEATTEVS
jgi:hypothetical protein